MSFFTQQKVMALERKSSKDRSLLPVLLGIAILSVGVALLAIFLIAEWAEVSPLHHAVQHVLIFLSGLGFGTSLLNAHRTRK